ncbi:hypothetical protein BCR41DRAFT_389456 [Lobosporangium transversale]|uniref:Uncharacterized protein n=1 Tax=Lobosporangium transversale TaxID=64571 RepID=A0A1Y2GB38_9FUNG|nr:hypothetical protein BCR41DRAFT_389456 [Lobosporangium transversale]ORZ05975.1 hypothetical protein BCR41DRAFT_389456 [Lobosporangium transversale]|eukprot:XP_021877356.1 hypothetical protein BCR41DRAFT_389456 [Lobosporangium transversale]
MDNMDGSNLRSLMKNALIDDHSLHAPTFLVHVFSVNGMTSLFLCLCSNGCGQCKCHIRLSLVSYSNPCARVLSVVRWMCWDWMGEKEQRNTTRIDLTAEKTGCQTQKTLLVTSMRVQVHSFVGPVLCHLTFVQCSVSVFSLVTTEGVDQLCLFAFLSSTSHTTPQHPVQLNPIHPQVWHIDTGSYSFPPTLFRGWDRSKMRIEKQEQRVGEGTGGNENAGKQQNIKRSLFFCAFWLPILPNNVLID